MTTTICLRNDVITLISLGHFSYLCFISQEKEVSMGRLHFSLAFLQSISHAYPYTGVYKLLSQVKSAYVLQSAAKDPVPSNPINLALRVVSEPLFQSSSQKTTLAQGMDLINLIG